MDCWILFLNPVEAKRVIPRSTLISQDLAYHQLIIQERQKLELNFHRTKQIEKYAL